MLGTEQSTTLEALIDEYSLRDVLAEIANICRAKADHISVNWQDRLTARRWNAAANAVDRCANSNGVSGVS